MNREIAAYLCLQDAIANRRSNDYNNSEHFTLLKGFSERKKRLRL